MDDAAALEGSVKTAAPPAGIPLGLFVVGFILGSVATMRDAAGRRVLVLPPAWRGVNDDGLRRRLTAVPCKGEAGMTVDDKKAMAKTVCAQRVNNRNGGLWVTLPDC